MAVDLGAVRRSLAGGGTVSVILLPNGVPVSEIADPVGVLRRAGILMSEETERLDAIERSRYVLVRIDGMGERWRCRRCGSKHAHFTVACVERPFKGLREGLRVYWQNTAIPDLDLSPEQRARRREIARLMGFGDLPSLSTHHPETARALATPDSDLDLGAWVLGTIDPVSTAKAYALAARINARVGRPLVRL